MPDRLHSRQRGVDSRFGQADAEQGNGNRHRQPFVPPLPDDEQGRRGKEGGEQKLQQQNIGGVVSHIQTGPGQRRGFQRVKLLIHVLHRARSPDPRRGFAQFDKAQGQPGQGDVDRHPGHDQPKGQQQPRKPEAGFGLNGSGICVRHGWFSYRCGGGMGSAAKE